MRALALETGARALVQRVRSRPDAAREAVQLLLADAMAAQGSDQAEEEFLLAAERLAEAYAEAWTDSFLLRQVRRFQAWSPPARLAKLKTDSLRRAGNKAYREDGVEAAVRLWRRSASVSTPSSR